MTATAQAFAFIDDEYTRQGYIAADPEFHEAIDFDYRPATGSEVTALENRAARHISAGDFEGSEKIIAEFMAKKIVRWSLKVRGSHDVPITAANFAKVCQTAQAKLYNIILGKRKSDDRPPPADPLPMIDEAAEGKN